MPNSTRLITLETSSRQLDRFLQTPDGRLREHGYPILLTLALTHKQLIPSEIDVQNP